MLIQKSFKNENATIYLIPTPIGNLEDITIRSLNTLKEVEAVFCEDTRVTAKLLNYYEISKPLHNYHEHNKEEAIMKMSKFLGQNKSIAIVSDAGMPGISDPAYEAINYANENDYNVVILPGSSAFMLPIIRSNFKVDNFSFNGFLSKKTTKKTQELQDILDTNKTTAIYESTHKLLATLELIKKLDENRNIIVARELTKIYEEYISGNVSEVLEYYENNVTKGEFVIVIGQSETEGETKLSINEQVSELIEQGESKKDAIKQVAKNNNLNKNEVYKNYFND